MYHFKLSWVIYSSPHLLQQKEFFSNKKSRTTTSHTGIPQPFLALHPCIAAHCLQSQFSTLDIVAKEEWNFWCRKPQRKKKKWSKSWMEFPLDGLSPSTTPSCSFLYRVSCTHPVWEPQRQSIVCLACMLWTNILYYSVKRKSYVFQHFHISVW